jgi:hypothetical protein
MSLNLLLEFAASALERRPPANDLERLWCAAEDGDAAEARRLLDAGVDINGDIGGLASVSTALHVAANKGHTEVVRLLLSRGADVNALAEELVTPMHLAAMHGYSEVRRGAAWKPECIGLWCNRPPARFPAICRRRPVVPSSSAHADRAAAA